MSTSRLCILLPLLLLAPGAIAAQDAPTQPPKSRFDRELTVSPAKVDDANSFAFSQEALVPLRNENAAPLYLQGFGFAFGTKEGQSEQIERVEEIPMLELDAAEARKSLADAYSGANAIVYEITEPAVRRTWADWGAPVQELGIATLLPYLSEARNFARMMAMEARLLAREGNHEESADMLRRLFVLGQHLGNSREPVLVEGLVGVGVSALATDRAMQIAQLPDAPNRYWALTTLPTPLFDPSHWLRSERIFVTATFPALREPELMTAERWAQTLVQLQMMAADVPQEGNAIQQAAGAFLATMQATQYLKSRGYTDQQIQEVDLFPTAARLMVEDYYQTFDEFSRLVHLPFPQGYPLMVEAEQRLADENAQTPAGGFRSLAVMVMPTLTRAIESPYHLDRQIGMLRIVEAVRDHAAANGGRLPASLAELRLPVPEDPMTGEAYGYAVDGNTFRLIARPYSEKDIHSGTTWTVTMRGN